MLAFLLKAAIANCTCIVLVRATKTFYVFDMVYEDEAHLAND